MATSTTAIHICPTDMSAGAWSLLTSVLLSTCMPTDMEAQVMQRRKTLPFVLAALSGRLQNMPHITAVPPYMQTHKIKIWTMLADCLLARWVLITAGLSPAVMMGNAWSPTPTPTPRASSLVAAAAAEAATAAASEEATCSCSSRAAADASTARPQAGAASAHTKSRTALRRPFITPRVAVRVFYAGAVRWWGLPGIPALKRS
mmetsp:Transcript_116833/g.308670  ORF Transcript_116833/g.308670 Transcript_116833/m.308670 type:complete len:203 (+) Transcript_116833:878-1486(+)